MVPEGWSEGRVQDFFYLQRGFDLTEKASVEGNVPVYSSSGLAYFHNESKVQGPGIVTGRKGSVGPVYFVEQDFWPHDTTLWVKDFKGNEIKYIEYFLNFLKLERFDEASSVPTLNRNNVHGVKCVFPPLHEQKKIAQILSTWDKAITVTEKLLANSQQQKKALMQQLLTGKKRLLDKNGVRFGGEWSTTTFGKACVINPARPPEPNNGLVSFVAMENVSEDAKLINHVEKRYTDVAKGFTSFIDGDVVVAKITPCFENGKGAYIEGMKNGIGFGSTEFHVLRSNELSDSKFIYYLTTTSEFRVRGEANMQGSAGQKRVTTEYLRSYKIKIPLLEEQQKIASVLSVADQDIAALQKKLDALKQEKKALMQQLLTGKRRVRIDN